MSTPRRFAATCRVIVPLLAAGNVALVAVAGPHLLGGAASSEAVTTTLDGNSHRPLGADLRPPPGPRLGSYEAPARPTADPGDHPRPGLVAGIPPAAPLVPLVSEPTSAARAVPVAASLGASGIPSRAVTAYRHAADVLARDQPGCGLTWTLVAGIGRVESDHGRFGASQLGVDGVSRPPIIGLPLDGSPGVALIRDTDGGRLDGDAVLDRAVGPMQFLPGTWAVIGSDGDGDGVRDPQDLDDAALATARYLCAGGGNLRAPGGRERAVFRYNHSADYVDLVLALADAYARGARVVGIAPLVPVATTPPQADPTPPAGDLPPGSVTDPVGLILTPSATATPGPGPAAPSPVPGSASPILPGGTAPPVLWPTAPSTLVPSPGPTPGVDPLPAPTGEPTAAASPPPSTGATPPPDGATPPPAEVTPPPAEVTPPAAPTPPAPTESAGATPTPAPTPASCPPATPVPTGSAATPAPSPPSTGTPTPSTATPTPTPTPDPVPTPSPTPC